MMPFRTSLWLSALFSLVITLMLSLPSGASGAASALEGVEWGLVELDGKELPVVPGERQPFIRFDPSKKQANGYAGCNNFFGGYTLKGSLLSFGPLGATRRACGERQDTIEMRFLKALDATRSWRIENGRMLLFDNDRVLARFELAGS